MKQKIKASVIKTGNCLNRRYTRVKAKTKNYTRVKIEKKSEAVTFHFAKVRSTKEQNKKKLSIFSYTPPARFNEFSTEFYSETILQSTRSAMKGPAAIIHRTTKKLGKEIFLHLQGKH